MKFKFALSALLSANVVFATDFNSLQREALSSYGAESAWTSSQLRSAERAIQVAQGPGDSRTSTRARAVAKQKADRLGWWIKQASYEKNAQAEKFTRNTALAGLNFADVSTHLPTNTCQQAPLIAEGVFQTTIFQPGTVWVQIDAPINGARLISTVGSEMDTDISVYDACPGESKVAIATNDDNVGLYAEYATTPGSRLTKRQWLAIRGESAGRIQTRISLVGESVSGRVTRPNSGQPYVDVSLYRLEGSFFSYVNGTSADQQLNYTLSFNAIGQTNYYLGAGFDYGELLPRLHPNAACMQLLSSSPLCDVASAAPLSFSPGQQRTGLDFTLDRGATLAGRVVLTPPVASGDVSAYVLRDGQAITSRSQTIDATGRFSIGALMPNLRYVFLARADSHKTTLYPNIECENDFNCELALGEEVAPGNYDIRPRRLSSLTINTVPTFQTQLSVTFHQLNKPPRTEYSFGQGSFRLPMPDGDSYVSIQASGFRPFLYGAASCTPSSNQPGCTNFADGIALSSARDQQISVALMPLPSVSGRILGGSGAMFAEVCSVQSSFNCLSQQVDASGGYRFERVAPGSYFVQVFGEEIVDSLYPNIPCQLAANIRCNPQLTAAQRITVGADDVANIDISVARTGQISGTLGLENAFSGAIELAKVGLTSGLYGQFYFNAGTYRIKDLLPGTYRARIPTDFSWFGQVYPGIDCLTSCDFNLGQAIEVTGGQTTSNINFSVSSKIAIAGVVTDERNQPVVFMPVDIFRYDSFANLQRDGATVTDQQGRYRYFARGGQNVNYVVATDSREHRNMVYQNVLCSAGASLYLGTCDATNATRLSLPAIAPGQFEQINFQLQLGTIFGTGFED